MICQAQPCTAESLGFITSARIGSSKFTQQWPFGTFQEGDYMVRYQSGAINQQHFGWEALSNDAQNVILVACAGALRISFNTTTLPQPTQAQAETLAAGTSVCFHHTGGTISIEYSSALYSTNTDGSPNPTFSLLTMVLATAAGGNTNNGFPPGCAEFVDCPDALGSPIRNISSEQPDIPQNPIQPFFPAIPQTPFPPDAPPAPTPPPLNGNVYICIQLAKPAGGEDDRCEAFQKLNPNVTECQTTDSSLCYNPGPGAVAGTGPQFFNSMSDCLTKCRPVCESPPCPPPPPGPPPNPPIPPAAPPSYNCSIEGCVDPGDGSGAYQSAADCNAGCSLVCADISVGGPLLGKVPPPLDCTCSLPVTFSMPGGKFPDPIGSGGGYSLIYGGFGYSLEWLTLTELVMTSDVVCQLAATILLDTGPGTYSGCIELLFPGSHGDCCSVTFDVGVCGACDATKTWTPCKPNYPAPGSCPKPCGGTCCDEINGLGIGGTITNVSLIFLSECMGVGPPDFWIGTKHFLCSFVNTVPGGASYLTDSYYDVTRVS